MILRYLKYWMIAAVGGLVIFTPTSRYLTVIPGGKWLILSMGFVIGFYIGEWWSKTKDGEEELLRGRLVRGEIRLTEYRLLCRELGISKKKPTSLKKEEDFSTIDGT